jgi:hypothetical protein
MENLENKEEEPEINYQIPRSRRRRRPTAVIPGRPRGELAVEQFKEKKKKT